MKRFMRLNPEFVDPNKKSQVYSMPSRDVTLSRLDNNEVLACRYVQRCGHQALYQVNEQNGKEWFWCSMCEPGREIK